MGNNLRSIAIYLPQFHPVPENDKWWGKGFTEWTNVTKAKPLFPGHYQPHLPADLGFYDLRVPEVRELQAAMAKDYGIYGFCYYHYWFNGKRILERPFQEVFESGRPDFPFMLCWANENWTRAWDGGETDILLAQHYSPEDDLAHIRSLIPYFKDKRYIRINNKPVFAVYRSTLLPDAKATVDVWRKEAAKHGIELYICRVESLFAYGEEFVKDGGFDAAIDFQPSGYLLKHFLEQRSFYFDGQFLRKLKDRFYKKIVKKISAKSYDDYMYLKKISIDYNDFVDCGVKLPFPDYKWYPCITPMWDNTPRRKKNAFIYKNATPQEYKKWLQSVIQKFKPYSTEENLIFINAWNEWAEGNHLEPCRKWGHQYLEATKEILSNEKANNN
jgi:lipopolysaccharide biosynthesis protein